MASTYTNLLYHLVFSTRHRQPLMTADLQDELYRYIGGIVRGEGRTLLEIGGVADHVHLLVKLKPDKSVSKMLQLIKGNSSKWTNDRPDREAKFAWQTGFGAFTVSESQAPSVRRYIQRQPQHHRTRSFQDEYLDLLKKHGIEFDERYLWD